MEQFKELYEKSRKMIESCQTFEQANVVNDFIELSRKTLLMSIKTPKNKKKLLKNRLFTIIINDNFYLLKAKLDAKFN